MKKYLAEFATEERYSQFRNSNDFVTPNVSLITSINEFRFNKQEDPVFLVNGTPYTDKVITLDAGTEYVLEGVHVGQIIINAKTFKPENTTIIKLNGVTIISDDSFGIKYATPAEDDESDKKWPGMDVILARDSHNFIVCDKPAANIGEGDAQNAALNSWKQLSIKGVGYLALYNNIGHGARGTKFTIAGPHIYADTAHDAIHGKNLTIFDGLIYVKNANDAIGTSDDGAINMFGGTVEIDTITGQVFDSRNTGYYLDESVFGEYAHNNIISIKDAYTEGTVTAYPTKSDYEDGINGVVISPIMTNINDGAYYNADENGAIVTSADKNTPNPYTGYQPSWVTTSDIIYSAPLAYVIDVDYSFIEVTGKIIYPIVRPLDAIVLDDPKFSWKGKLNDGYDNKFDVYLNNAYIETLGNVPSITNLPDKGRIKITAASDTINLVINKDVEGDGDHDAIKSENNLFIEVKNDSVLYVTSNIGDGVDGGETKFTDSKGTFIATNCGERGVKGNAIIIGPDANISNSEIKPDSYITDPNAVDNEGKSIYTTFDGIFIAKGNVLNHTVGLVTYPDGMTDKDEKEAYAKTVGFADVFARNGKASKGMFGTTNTELKGVAIIGSLGAVLKIDEGNADNLYVTNLLMDAVKQVNTVEEQYKAVPYNGAKIEY